MKAMRLESPCEEYAVTQKHGKYDKSFAETLPANMQVSVGPKAGLGRLE